jgi:hypothetical protein
VRCNKPKTENMMQPIRMWGLLMAVQRAKSLIGRAFTAMLP